MNHQRLRAVLTTMALVLGVGTMSAVAAPMLRDDAAQLEQSTETPSEIVSETAEEATEDNGGGQATEPPGRGEATEPPAADNAEDAREQAAEKSENSDKGQRPDHPGPKAGRGVKEKGNSDAGKSATASDDGPNNAHGKAVSDAARGNTEPVGDCRNHGHWVSTVAKGKASCDDNP